MNLVRYFCGILHTLYSFDSSASEIKISVKSDKRAGAVSTDNAKRVYVYVDTLYLIHSAVFDGWKGWLLFIGYYSVHLQMSTYTEL